MALLAVLNHGDPSWNGNYAQIEFHSYNERYEGSYPNLYFCFDVQARIVAINGGWWMIQANTTFNYGGVQRTHGIYTGKVYGASGWYFVGSHRKACGCGRSFTFGDGCSVSGYPNLSGNGSITSPTIGPPSFTARAENIDQRTCDIVWDTTDNPYNMYRMYVKYPDGHYSSQLPMDGSYSLEGLNSNTSYTYRVEAWQADGRGSAVAGKDVTFKTLENYPEISVTEVTYEIEDAGETDNVTFRFKSTDDSHVSKWHYQIQGGPPFSGTSPTYTESQLAKNLESYIDVWTEDTLGRTSAKFRQYFHTTFTKMTVWRRTKTNGYQLFDSSKLPTKTIGGATLKNNSDGSFTISGSGKLSDNFNYAYYYGGNPLKVGRLTLKLNGPNYIVPLIQVIGLNKLGDGSVSNRVWTMTNEMSINITQDILNKTKDIYIVFYGGKGSTIIPGTVKPMLYQDGDGTWEPFTGGRPFDGYLRGFMYCIQNMIWGYARPYILNSGRKWLNALPYDIVRRFIFSGKTNAAGLEVHKIYGNTVQETTKGYQLFDASKLPSKSGGGANVNNNEDGSYSVTGSGTLSTVFNHYVELTKEETLKIIKIGKLYGKVERSVAPYPSFIIYANGKWSELNLVDSDIHSINITEEMLNASDLYSRLRFYSSSESTIKTGTVKPMLYQDGDGTWEPFTGGRPGPNPDGPLPIKNFSMIKIYSRTNQLFDASKVPTKSAGGATVTSNGSGTYTVSGSGNLTSEYLNISSYSKDELLKMLKPGKIFITSVPSMYPYAYFRLDFEDGRRLETRSMDNKGIEITKEDLKRLKNAYYGFYGAKGMQIKPESIKPMVYQDGDGTWEAFNQSVVQKGMSLAKGDVYSKGTILRKMKEVSVTKDFGFSLQGTYENTLRFDSMYLNDKKAISGNGYCNKLLKGDDVDNGDYEHFRFSSVNKGLVIFINKSRLVTPDVSGLAKYLETADIKLLYELEYPTTEYITIPTITSFDPNTVAFTDSEVETQIEWRPAASSTLTERFYAVEQYRKVLNENT